MNQSQRTLALDVAHTVRNAAWHPGGEAGAAPADSFTMQRETYSCGAPACLAGWTVRRAYDLGLTDRDVGEIGYIHRKARELLGLGPGQALALFAPQRGTESEPQRWEGFRFQARPGDEDFISPAHAAACLEHLAETGQVDWHTTLPEEEKQS